MKKSKKYGNFLISTMMTIFFVRIIFLNFPTFFYGAFSLIWPKAQGTIIEIEMIEKQVKDSALWMPVIKYAYTIENKNFTGNKESFSTFIFGKQWAIDILKKYELNGGVDVFYNPFNQQTSCLRTGPEIAATLYSILGVVGLLYVFRSLYQNKNQKKVKMLQ